MKFDLIYFFVEIIHFGFIKNVNFTLKKSPIITYIEKDENYINQCLFINISIDILMEQKDKKIEDLRGLLAVAKNKIEELKNKNLDKDKEIVDLKVSFQKSI